MQIYGFFSNAGVTRSPSAASPFGIDAAPFEQKTGPSLANLMGVDSEVAANRKAIAKQKLGEVKDQLRMLRFWASDPEALARIAKQLAQQLGTAARQFAGGSSAGMAGGDGAATGAASAATAAASAALSAMEAHADKTAAAGDQDVKGGRDAGPASFAERAYREFSSDSAGDRSDANTVAEFKAVAEQLKQILRKTEQDLRAKGLNSDADEARKAGAALVSSMASLEPTGAPGATAATLAIPTSVSI